MKTKTMVSTSDNVVVIAATLGIITISASLLLWWSDGWKTGPSLSAHDAASYEQSTTRTTSSAAQQLVIASTEEDHKAVAILTQGERRAGIGLEDEEIKQASTIQSTATQGREYPDTSQLRVIYKASHEKFMQSGLNTTIIAATRSSFNGLDEAAKFHTPWPRLYKDFNPPLPNYAVRILAIPLEASPGLAAAGTAITSQLMRLLPQGVEAFPNRRNQYHVTVFHTSRPDDTRPDAFVTDGGTDLSLSPSDRPKPSDGYLREELRVIEEVVESTEVPVLEFERVVLTDTGTLLFTWTDPSGVISNLRNQLWQRFPGACTKQSAIIHTSLVRILSPTKLDKYERAEIERMCETWNSKLAGRRWSPKDLWFVYESEFSTIQGDTHRVQLGAPA